MIYQVDMDEETRLLVSHLSPNRKHPIKEALRTLAKEPQSGKPLQRDLMGLWSYRVGSLRIIYSINRSAKKIHVVALGPRRTIYEIVAKEVRKQHL